MNFKPSTLVTLIIVLFTACANQQSKTSCEKALPMLVQSKSNTSMRIDVPEHLNDLELGKPVFIVVDNLSKAKIEVTPDNDLRIFWFKGDSWVAVKNKADYLGAIETISAKTNSDPGGQTYYADPDISGQDEPVQVCIVLEGILEPAGSQSKVIAFIEVTLNP